MGLTKEDKLQEKAKKITITHFVPSNSYKNNEIETNLVFSSLKIHFSMQFSIVDFFISRNSTNNIPPFPPETSSSGRVLELPGYHSKPTVNILTKIGHVTSQ